MEISPMDDAVSRIGDNGGEYQAVSNGIHKGNKLIVDVRHGHHGPSTHGPYFSLCPLRNREVLYEVIGVNQRRSSNNRCEHEHEKFPALLMVLVRIAFHSRRIP